jgi:hypothetical protein
MFEEISKIFEHNEIHICSKCSQNEYIDYIADFNLKKMQLNKRIIEYKKCVDDYQKKLCDYGNRIEYFGQIKNMPSMDNYKEYTIEYLKHEQNKYDECQSNISKYTGYIKYYENELHDQQNIKPLSFTEFYNQIWLKMDYYDRKCVAYSKGTTCILPQNRCEFCYDE